MKDWQIEKIVEMWPNNSLRSIAYQIGCTAPTVVYYANKLGLPKRKPGQRVDRAPMAQRARVLYHPAVRKDSFIKPPTLAQLMAGR